MAQTKLQGWLVVLDDQVFETVGETALPGLKPTRLFIVLVQVDVFQMCW